MTDEELAAVKERTDILRTLHKSGWEIWTIADLDALIADVERLQHALELSDHATAATIIQLREAGRILLRVSLPPRDVSGNQMWLDAAKEFRG